MSLGGEKRNCGTNLKNRAPEYKFPYAANDCFDALKWVRDDLMLSTDLERSLTHCSAARMPLL